MGSTSTLSLAPKYPELGTFSSSCSECFLGNLASNGSEHPPGRSEFETWPSQQPREVFQPLSCYISIHHHIFLEAKFSVSWPKWRTLIYSFDREMPEGFHAPHFRHAFTQTSLVKAPVIPRVCNSPVFSSFLSAHLLTSETPFYITSTFQLSALLLCKPRAKEHKISP